VTGLYGQGFRALDLAEHSLDRRLCAADLRVAGIDPVQASRYFRRHYGLTFQAFHRAMRMGAGLCEIASFASRYFGTSSGGFFCKWPMPFRQSFRVELENVDPDLDTEVFSNVLYQLTDALPKPAGYFHAQFNTG
jgi:hypothetical protein